MPLSTATLIAVPVVGGMIGYLTNRIAVAMIFRPIKPVNVLGWKVQGLIGRRQQELADSIGRVVGGHLIEHRDMVQALDGVDFEALIQRVLGESLQTKVDEMRKMPLVGAFLTDERIDDLKASVARGIAKRKDVLLTELEGALKEGLDVQALVSEKVSGFSIPKLEQLVLEVASKELRAIEILGGLLGFLIGIGQVALIHFLG